MRTETYTRNIYEYDELSEKAKEHVKQWLNESMQTVDIFTMDCKVDIDEMFPNSDLNVEYSVAFSQGDYFFIYGQFSLMDLLNNLRKDGDYLSDDEYNYLKWAFTYATNDYIHKVSSNDSYSMEDFSYDAEYDIEYYQYEDDEDVLAHGGDKEEIFERFDDACAGFLDELCADFYEKGRDFFLYEFSDAEAIEICNDYEFEFYEDGELYEG